ncbi:MAG: response regulator transcription factor [Eubacteriales bacterium]|nr:response regulator transcription factor [Eubacteriales bacterium]MDD4324334.1 response regulator transcription factor [Eubacteriales bacterium]MDD4541153.1 response regulator transcription factor [Eubacteriales bacterium]
MPRMLIADDNRKMTEILAEYARREGYTVDLVYDGQAALNHFKADPADVVLLDVMMPFIDGFTVCREIRRISQVPILMITARNEDRDRIMGLDIGADDYIVKPFSPAEVMARVRAIMRRLDFSNEESDKSGDYNLGSLHINMEKAEVLVDGEEISLTHRERELLWLLASNPERVFSRDELIDRLWGYDYEGDLRTVDSHIKRLRAKLEDLDNKDWSIATVRGQGYKFRVL